MSIDDIIRHIDEDCYYICEDYADYARVEPQYIPKIVALLKAGQAMRHAAGEVIQVDYYGGYERRLKESVAAWDAATKEDI